MRRSHTSELEPRDSPLVHQLFEETDRRKDLALLVLFKETLNEANKGLSTLLCCVAAAP